MRYQVFLKCTRFSMRNGPWAVANQIQHLLQLWSKTFLTLAFLLLTLYYRQTIIWSGVVDSNYYLSMSDNSPQSQLPASCLATRRLASFPGRVFPFISNGRTTRTGISCLRMRQNTVVFLCITVHKIKSSITENSQSGLYKTATRLPIPIGPMFCCWNWWWQHTDSSS